MHSRVDLQRADARRERSRPRHRRLASPRMTCAPGTVFLLEKVTIECRFIHVGNSKEGTMAKVAGQRRKQTTRISPNPTDSYRRTTRSAALDRERARQKGKRIRGRPVGCKGSTWRGVQREGAKWMTLLEGRAGGASRFGTTIRRANRQKTQTRPLNGGRKITRDGDGKTASCERGDEASKKRAKKQSYEIRSKGRAGRGPV